MHIIINYYQYLYGNANKESRKMSLKFSFNHDTKKID